MKSKVLFRLQVLCVGCELVLSPKDEDRYVRYRFVPAPKATTPSAKGSAWADSSLYCAGEPGQFRLGQQYELEFEAKEA